MTKDQLTLIAKRTAEYHKLDPALVCAVIHHESGNWKQYASRYEPAFYDRYIKDMKLSDTEKQLRAFSFGLMQVMGQVAREFGFPGDNLMELLEPHINLEYGCRKLAKCLLKAGGDVNKGLLLYNGGGAPGYPALVIQHIGLYR